MSSKRPPERPTVQWLADHWAELCPRPDPETTRHNCSMVKGFVAAFAEREVDDISPLEAQRWAVDGHMGAVRYVKSMLNDARRLGLCETNPVADMALIVSGSTGRRNITPPTLDEMRALAEIAGEVCGPPFRALVLTAATTGMRQVELCRLRAPRDVVQEIPSLRFVVRWPKRTRRTAERPGEATRLVGFPEGAEDAERAVRTVLSDPGPVFWRRHSQRPDGPREAFTPGYVRHLWSRVCDRHGRRVSFHELRHGCATWLIEAGHRPIDVAMLLHGHADPELVLSLYNHPSAESALDRLRAPA